MNNREELRNVEELSGKELIYRGTGFCCRICREAREGKIEQH
jgi:hypothetical protein